MHMDATLKTLEVVDQWQFFLFRKQKCQSSSIAHYYNFGSEQLNPKQLWTCAIMKRYFLLEMRLSGSSPSSSPLSS